MPGYYPIMLNIRQRPALVIGGDSIAAAKAASLLACGAHVSILSPSFAPEIETLIQEWSSQVTLRQKFFERGDLAGAFVVVAATTDQQLIEEIWQEAQEREQLLNIVDVPAYCNFILPSILRRGQLTITVSTEGASPSLSKRIRQHLETLFPSTYDLYLQLATVARKLLREHGVSYDRRDDFFGAYYASPILQQLEAGAHDEALSTVIELLTPYGIHTTIDTLLRELQDYKKGDQTHGASTTR